MKIIKLIKLYPVVLNIIILFMMVMYILDIDLNINRYIYTFIGQSFIYNAMLLYFSFKFKFCVWHRLLIYNMTFCLLLETLTNFGFKLNNYAYIVVISTILTIFVSIIIFKRHGTFNKEKSDRGIKITHKWHRKWSMWFMVWWRV